MSIFVDHKALKHLLKKLKDVLIVSPADGEVLTYEALSAKWKNKPLYKSGCRVYATNQVVPSATHTRINYIYESYDILDEYNPATYRFQPKKNGYYLIIGQLCINNLADGNLVVSGISLNGAGSGGVYAIECDQVLGGASTPCFQAVGILYLTTTDYIEGYCYHNYGANRTLWGAYCVLFASYLFG